MARFADCALTVLVCAIVVEGGTFRSVPTTVKTHENDTVLLPCYADLSGSEETGGPAEKIRWYKDVTELLADTAEPPGPDYPNERLALHANGSLEVRNIQHSDTGEYTCEVVRKEPWSTIRQTHAIEVLYPPSVSSHPESGFIQVKRGEDVKISCNASGVPHPIMTWKYKGEEMQLLDNRESLEFPASSQHLSGEYECIAANGVGNPARAVINLNIIYPPAARATRSWVHSSPGVRAQLECAVSADPTAEVRWYKGENPVQLDSRVLALLPATPEALEGEEAEDRRHALLLRQVRVSDFGIYTCRAVNELGVAEAEVQLSGVANPGTFKRPDNPIAPVKRTSYTLIWEVDSYTAIIEYSLWFRPRRTTSNRDDWTKVTVPAEHSSGPLHSKAYTLQGLSEGTVYEAMLFSRNRYGWSKGSQVARFATAGADLGEDVITSIQIEENIMPLDISPVQRISAATKWIPININVLIIIMCVSFC